jgi:hypothetical protein
LVAELGAAFAAAALGLATEPRPGHARYVAHWLDPLRAGRRTVFTAASKAQKAADWLLVAAATGTAPVDHRAGPPSPALVAEQEGARREQRAGRLCRPALIGRRAGFLGSRRDGVIGWPCLVGTLLTRNRASDRNSTDAPSEKGSTPPKG